MNNCTCVKDLTRVTARYPGTESGTCLSNHLWHRITHSPKVQGNKRHSQKISFLATHWCHVGVLAAMADFYLRADKLDISATQWQTLPYFQNELCGRLPQYAPPPASWPLTLKVVSESRMIWAISVPILVFLGLSVLDLGPTYVTDRRQMHIIA